MDLCANELTDVFDDNDINELKQFHYERDMELLGELAREERYENCDC